MRQPASKGSLGTYELALFVQAVARLGDMPRSIGHC